MAKIVEIDKHREPIDRKKLLENDYYQDMIGLLRPIRLHWKGSSLQIRYEIGWPNIYRQFLNERAWVLRVFGAVRVIRHRPSGIEATTKLAFPAIAFSPKEKIEGVPSLLQKDLLVTWQTKQPAPAEMVLEAESLKKNERYNIKYRF